MEQHDRAVRAFSDRDQQLFAELSGDFNPLHLDALLARRLQYGAQVVHGVHMLLWALDRWSASLPGPVALRSLDVTFERHLGLHEPVALGEERLGADAAAFELRKGDLLVLVAKITWRTAETLETTPSSNPSFQRAPFDVPVQQLAGYSGGLDIEADPARVRAVFPHLAQKLSHAQIALLLATTRLVGMQCPGLHSVYSSLSLAQAPAHDSRQLNFRVQHVDARYGLVTMAIAGLDLQGTAVAFRRAPPQQQPAAAALVDLVAEGEFDAQRALVVGGSRGLGEVAGKLLALGHADVTLTYARGERDAARIVTEICNFGGRARAVPLDVQTVNVQALRAALAPMNPTHLYYFATPFIFSGSRDGFSPELFQTFCSYYVAGFAALLDALPSLRHALMPSSIAVDEHPADMKEYVAAKAAAEALARSIAAHRPISIFAPRLPRLLTDQTARPTPTINLDPVPVMLQHLRTLADVARVGAS